MNQLKPFSVTMQPLIQEILDMEKIVQNYAGMATMERIKGLSSTTLESSSKLQQVRDVIMQIREEIKPLAKLNGTSQRFLLPPSVHFPSIHLTSA